MNQVSLLNKFSPLFIGFENLFDNLEKFGYEVPNYPPYNIVSLEKDKWQIEIAVAGFGEDDLEVVQENGNLYVQSEGKNKENDQKKYLYKGISTRKFKLSWKLSQWVEVKDVVLENGILKILLERNVPESMKPKKIDIKLIK